jgi:hypothetical protein
MAFDLTYLILHFIGCNGTCRPMLAVPGSPFTHWLGIFFMWHGSVFRTRSGRRISHVAVQFRGPMSCKMLNQSPSVMLLCNAGFLRIGAT